MAEDRLPKAVTHINPGGERIWDIWKWDEYQNGFSYLSVEVKKKTNFTKLPEVSSWAMLLYFSLIILFYNFSSINILTRFCALVTKNITGFIVIYFKLFKQLEFVSYFKIVKLHPHRMHAIRAVRPMHHVHLRQSHFTKCTWPHTMCKSCLSNMSCHRNKNSLILHTKRITWNECSAIKRGNYF